MTKLKLIICTISALLLFTQCDKSDDPVKEPEEPKTEKKSFNGLIEKGPFISGSTITVSELDKTLSLTGRNFTTQIKGDNGSFEIKDIELASKYVQLSVDGFFFNEVEGALSSSKITLMALADLTDKSSVNVNLLTHLQRERVIELIGEGKSFSGAKKQSLKEVLATFHINGDYKQPEEVSIVGSSTESEVLLAISTIMLNGNSEAQFTELLSQFSEDLKDNGTIDDTDISEKIKANSKALRGIIDRVKSNIVDRYKELGQTIELGKFENYVDFDGDGILNKDDTNGHYPIETAKQLTDTLADCHKLFADYSKLNVIFDNVYTQWVDAPDNSWNAIFNHNVQADNPRVEKLWFDAYKIIFKLNNILENLSKINITTEEKNSAKGQALVIRSMVLYHLNTYFGDVPITTSQYKDDFLDLHRSTKEELYQFMIQDLDKASTILLENDQISKHTALCLLARLYSLKKDWQNAAKYAEVIINSGNYSLESKYEDAFAKGSKEIIWGIDKGNDNIFNEVYSKGEEVTILRYAEALMICGEAAYQIGDEMKAIQYFNQLLERRSEPTLAMVDMNELITLYDDEFETEGNWFATLKRFNMAENRLNIQSEKLILPIPQKAIKTNGNISQNPGY